MSNATKTSRVQLATRIQKEIRLSQKAFAKSIEHAVEAGKLLLQAKRGLNHGQWGEWLEENVSVTERQAQKYMRLAKNKPKLDKSNPNWSSEMTIAEALQSLSELMRDANGSQPPSHDDVLKLDPKKHKEHVAELQRFVDRRRLTKDDRPIEKAVQQDIDGFIRDIINVARKHARTLVRTQLKDVDAEPDLVAMVLARQLVERFDVEKHFAPKFLKKAA